MNESRKNSDPPDQPERLRFNAVTLPSVFGMFSCTDLYTPREIEKGSEVGIGIAHSDADQGLSLVIFDELKCGACFFTVLHQ